MHFHPALSKAVLKLTALAAAVVACIPAPLPAAPADSGLRGGDLLAICGDSITDQKIYSRYVALYLLACGQVPNVQSMQFGWPGESAYIFRARQKNDCLAFAPTAATIFYGMNDAGYAATTPDRLNGYAKNIAEVIRNFKESGVRFVVLGSPGAVDTDTFKKIDQAVYNKTLGEFRDAAKKVALEQGVAFADIHAAMMETMAKAKAKYGNAYVFAGADGVHPGPNGHLVIAHAFLKALGCFGDIGTITVNWKGRTASATDGHKILSNVNGKIEVESTRYPFCFFGDADKPTTRSMVEFLPFNDDLNRYRLVVTGAPAPKMRVTWGKDSRVYTAAELEKGVNLAADFLDNPFSESFAKLYEAVLNQQMFDATASKTMLHSLIEWRRNFPEQSAAYDIMQKAVIEKAKAAREATRAAVVPVKHMITIEPAS